MRRLEAQKRKVACPRHLQHSRLRLPAPPPSFAPPRALEPTTEAAARQVTGCLDPLIRPLVTFQDEEDLAAKIDLLFDKSLASLPPVSRLSPASLSPLSPQTNRP